MFASPNGPLDLFRDRVAVASDLVDEGDEFRVHEGVIPDQPERQRAGARLDDIVRRIEDDPAGFEGVDDLVDAIRDSRAHDLHSALAAARGDVYEADQAGPDGNTEGDRQGHQPTGVHSD